MGAEGILHRYRGLLRDTIKNGGRQVHRQPACTALLHCPRDNPPECPVTRKQRSTRINAALARAGPPAA
jgi:hypothetical protein